MTVLALFLTTLVAQPGRFGEPACSEPGQERAVRTAFHLCHDSENKIPRWTLHELTPDHPGTVSRRPRGFRRDAEFKAGATNTDYRNSGFSRGHLVPAADLAWSAQALDESFLLSNAAPQVQSMNASSWRRLENALRALSSRAEVWIVTGVIVGSHNETIGEGKVTVPESFFKAVLALQDGQWRMFAAIIPNRADARGPLSQYMTTVDEIEKRTALDLFPGLDDDAEATLESVRNEFPAANKPRITAEPQPAANHLIAAGTGSGCSCTAESAPSH